MPEHLARLFTPAQPPRYFEPLDVPPEHRRTKYITGIAQYVTELNTPDEHYVPTESWLQQQQREKRLNAEEHQRKLAQTIASCRSLITIEGHVRVSNF